MNVKIYLYVVCREYLVGLDNENPNINDNELVYANETQGNGEIHS